MSVKIVNPITVVQGGSPTPPTPASQDIRFYDLDGTLVESWSLAELQNKTALPANPTAPTGLTAKGWNWTLQELKTENAPMNVGQLYAPTDGKTHLFVEVDANHLNPALGLGINGTATVDWGDGSAAETMSGSSVDTGVTITHTYAQAGSYEVTIDVPTGSSAKIRGNSATVSFLWRLPTWSSTLTDEHKLYASQLRRLWLGERIYIGAESLTRLGLAEIVVPDYYPETSVGTYYLFGCVGFNKPIILPPAVTTIENSFLLNCPSFNQPLTIPPAVSSIDFDFLNSCASFNQPLTIPSTVTTIGNNFLCGYYLGAYTRMTFNQPLIIPPPVTSIGNSFLYGCYSFSHPITIPSTVTSIGNKFLSSCYAFSNLTTETTASPTDADSLSCDSPAAKTYAEGVTITGSGAATWITNLPNSTNNPFRKLINGNE